MVEFSISEYNKLCENAKTRGLNSSMCIFNLAYAKRKVSVRKSQKLFAQYSIDKF